jgi:sigma-B regulation protein RsbU (phosphoserine phosphatase)
MKKATILCVDDEKMILSSLKSQLKNHLGNSFFIETVESAEEAIELLKELNDEGHDVPLVISDQIMPGMKGDKFLIEVGNLTKGAKKIMLTGQASAEAVGNAINNANLYRYISKPWDVNDLNMTVSEAIRSYEQEVKLLVSEEHREELLDQLSKANQYLEDKVRSRTLDIEKQSKVLEEKNSHITSNINYAKHIQDSFLPTENDLVTTVPNSFALYLPKDIVSGDFYWLKSIDQNKFYLSVSDCTGHGVAGAFMSLIGASLFKEETLHNKIIAPNTIFDSLKSRIISSLNQTIKTHPSGMDASLLTFDMETNVLQFSGAYSRLLITRETKEGNIKTKNGDEITPYYSNETHSIFSLDGDRQPLALSLRAQQAFTLYETELKQGDHIYLSSDGYQDQFGGEFGKKFMKREFAKLLLTLNGKTKEAQKDILFDIFFNWKGDYDQTDDICVVGFQVP